MNFQETGSFQLVFLSSEFYDGSSKAPVAASRDVKLSGRYKLKIKGIQFNSEAVATNAWSDPVVDKPWVFLVQSPQFSNNFTRDTTGYCFTLNGFMLTDPAAQAGKISSTTGDCGCEFLTYIQDRMELFITAGDTVLNNGFVFNTSLYNALGGLQGAFIFTFEFEKL